MSITEIKVDSIQNIKQLIIETQKDDTIGRYRSPALFRGLPNSTYTLQTSLYRRQRIMILVGKEWLLDNIMVCRLV